MKSARHVRVLMLGWEYPPRFAGGLGKACQGLAQAMAKVGAQIFFVLPTFPEKVTETRLEVVGARECMLNAGWQPLLRKTPRAITPQNLTHVEVDAKLFPYDFPTHGQIPQDLKRVIDRMSLVEPSQDSLWHAGGHNSGPNSEHGPDHNSEHASAGVAKELREETETILDRISASRSDNSGEIYGRNLWAEIERFCFTVRRMGETHEVDLVHAHDWMTFPAAFEFQRMTGVPVYLHIHATEYDRSGDQINQDVFRIERDGFRRANHIFAVSRYTAGILEKLYGINKKKISVVYNAPDTTERPTSATLGTSRELKVVFLGRLTFQKGPDHFLRAAALVAQVIPNAKFILCGSGDMLSTLRHQADRLGISEKVKFTGFLEPADVDRMLMTSRVLVMPSVSEPFGLVALEAILCGIPVVLSKQSGVKEVLRRALLVDFWDHEKLADHIIASLRLPNLSKQLVEDGMDQLRLLSWEKSAQQVIETYGKYLGSTYALAIGGAHGH